MAHFLAFLLWLSVQVNGMKLTSDQYEHYWQEWKSFYGKSYRSVAEEITRFALWKDNVKVISHFNFPFERSVAISAFEK